MRTTSAVLAVAALALTAGCGGGDREPKAMSSTQPVGSGSPGTSDQGENAAATDEAPTPTPTVPGGDETREVLHATVGTKEYPDSYVIRLADGTGQPATSLPAGTYTIDVSDFSEMHNFHLTGPGGVEQSTPVSAVTDTTWQVTLTPGTYTFVCDPHPSMTGGFTVA